MTTQENGGLTRPEVSVQDAERIALECYGLTVTASELGSNQDRNFVLLEENGTRSVLRIDNPVFADAARDGQHAALEAYRSAGVVVPAILPGLDGNLTQRWNGFAARRSEFAAGTSLVDAGYLAPVVLAEFGELAGASANALASLSHPGLDRAHMWDMRVASTEARALSRSIGDVALRTRVVSAAEDADEALGLVSASLPVQAIHGDLTDDNVTALPGDDGRLHPHTVLDLGDLALGWRVAELAVTAASMLHHEPNRPLRVLDTVRAFHRVAPLSAAEARAVWPLVVLRAALLVASGWRQLEIDGDNDYARERIAGEQRIFDAATLLPLAEMTEQVVAAVGMQGIPHEDGLRLVALPAPSAAAREGALASLLPGLVGEVMALDPGVESELLEGGFWLEDEAEDSLAVEALVSQGFSGEGVAAAVFPAGVYRLTRTQLDSPDAAETFPLDTEIRLLADAELVVTAPVSGRILPGLGVPGSESEVRILTEGGWQLVVAGITPSARAGQELAAGDQLGTLEADAAHTLFVGLRRSDAPELEGHFVAPERATAWRRFAPDAAAILGLASLAQRDEAADELARREGIFASAQERYYEHPMQIERGWKHHLVDTTGRSYIDLVNNVTGLGHGHPGVADAANRQIRILNTNSRFLYRELAEYSERLLEMLPEGSGLDTVLLVNSGSEAVDLALRLAQAATGRKTVVSLREAYHGWTMASDAVTTSAYDNPYALETRPDWVHVADVPNRFRGTYRGLDTGAQYAADLGVDLAALSAEGRDVAAFICESVLGNAGGVLLPEGYLADAYARVRAAGGLCIADEVQVGFGRMGTSFWGFEQSGVVPDIITIAKPMGNGFPIGGVITSKKVADALASQGAFFSSAGGNPLSCRVGIAVLDAMRDEGLQENARVVGERLRSALVALADRHDIVGPIHGEGLYLGVELVRDRETLEPATAEAAAICERLRELGLIVLTTSERSNVLKVKPPLCLTAESADRFVAALDEVLTTGW